MSEVLNPELFVEDVRKGQFAEVIGDLSVSSFIEPQGNSENGYRDDQPQGGYQFVGFVE